MATENISRSIATAIAAAALSLASPVLAQQAPTPWGAGIAPTELAKGRPELSRPPVPHPGLTSIAFSPDGSRIATASLDNEVTLWNTAAGQKSLTLGRHHARIAAVAYSRDGKHLATASWDGTARVWDASSGQALVALRGHTGAVVAVAFSPDGLRLATASSDRTAKIWDAASGQNLLTLSGHAGAVYGAAFSPDGARLATASWDKTAKVWDAREGRELLTLSGHSERLHSVAFSPDGKRLVTGSLDKSAIVWDAASGRKLLNCSGHGGAIWTVAFSPDGERLASASEDGTARVWDAVSGKTVLTLSGHSGVVYGVAFAPDGKRLATAGQDGAAKLWDARLGSELAIFSGDTGVSAGTGERSGISGKKLALETEPELAPANTNLRPGYRIGAGDVLQVHVWKEPEASVPEVVVRSDGKITMPIIKDVEVSGLTPAEAEKLLTEKLSRFINGPEVTVLVREITSEKVYLVGAVKKEGPVPLRSSMTVLQALAEAGGLTDYAKKKNIYVLRNENQKQNRLPFNYEEVIKGERTEQNIVVLPGDMIVVP